MISANNHEHTRRLLLDHCKRYPDLQIQDVFKFIHQSVFGCEHMISSLENAVCSIEEEYRSICVDREKQQTEYLDGEYCRVPLSYLDRGLSTHTFGKLFFMSAEKETLGSEEFLIRKLCIAEELIIENKLPFSRYEFEVQLKEWKENGFCALHHSDIFREKYKPSYRVISARFVPFIDLLIQLDQRLKNGKVRLAIDGHSASGKTTLSKMLETVYGCTVFHMDDFFLRPEQRTQQRYNIVGGNFDKERLIQEVIIPLNKGETVNYRRFDCSEMKLSETVCITPAKLTVIEGAYSMHPELSEYYNFSVFLDISDSLQKERIENRNTPLQAEAFFNKWIPLERAYFSGMNIKEKCDMTISVL